MLSVVGHCGANKKKSIFEWTNWFSWIFCVDDMYRSLSVSVCQLNEMDGWTDKHPDGQGVAWMDVGTL